MSVLRKSIFWIGMALSSISSADTMTEAQLIEYSKSLMYKKNDISSTELASMYGKRDRKILILPISGTSWPYVLEKMPDGYIKSISGHFNSRADSQDLIAKIDAVYQSTQFETANTLVTRSNGYNFCLVDDGLRKEFENQKGFLRSYFAGVLPVYFEREDVFLFMRHHEASHCLDNDDAFESNEQKVLSTMINESIADLTATLVYANRHGNYDLFYKLIKPMRMANSMDVEHTTEDIVEHMISTVDAERLHNINFDKVMEVRRLLISKMESKEYLTIMIKNAYEKQVVSLYLKKKLEEQGQYQNASIVNMLDQNTDVLNKLVTRDIYESIDLDRRFDSMVNASLDNIFYYSAYLNPSDPVLKNFPNYAGSLGMNLREQTKIRLKKLYQK